MSKTSLPAAATQWRRFEAAIQRATTSCETSGNTPANHFAGAGKMVDLGSGTVNWDLS